MVSTKQRRFKMAEEPKEAKFFLDWRDPKAMEKLTTLHESVNGEHPLPCALVCAAYIDKCLAELIASRLKKGETAKKLLKSDSGLIGSLSNRAKFAYLLGIIDKPTFQDIELICEIRNMFAHSESPLDFDSKDIAKRCSELKTFTPIRLDIPELPKSAKAVIDKLNSGPRDRFVGTTFGIINVLASLPDKLKKLATPHIDEKEKDDED
jgi:DNA-binding MltR family transcriptional regulator